MDVPILDLDSLMPPDWQNDISDNDTVYVNINDNDFDYDTMNDLMNQMEDMNVGYDEGFIGHSVAWGAMGIGLIVLILCAILGRYLYVKRKKINYFLADAKKPAKPPRWCLLWAHQQAPYVVIEVTYVLLQHLLRVQ